MDKRQTFVAILITFTAAIMLTSIGWQGECVPGFPCNLYFVLFFVLIMYLAYRGLNNVPFLKDWYRVQFSSWYPRSMDYMALAGLSIHNSKNIELEECVAELLSYYDDFQIEHSFPAIVPYFRDGATLPMTLYWLVGRDLKTKDTIGIGKDGHISIVFPLTKEESEMVAGKTHIYKIRGVGTDFQHPMDNGYLELRISAKGLEPPTEIIRLEIKDKAISIKTIKNKQEITKIQMMNELPKKNKITKSPA